MSGQKKHYFEGERRICSAIGGGFTHVEWDSIDASQDKVVAPICDELFSLLDDGVEEAMHCVEVNEMDIPDGVIHRMLRTEATKPHDDPEPVYYYHNDHLGGTAYLTDQAGQVAQTLAYLPYGEDWVDVTAFMYDTSQIGFYQFNGKEKDPETDYLYYGARYYWPDAWNGWLSPDPLMDEYPSISPYAYCNWNPVNLVDPDGKKVWIYSGNGVINYQAGMSSRGLSDFSKLTVDALNSIYSSGVEGSDLIYTLCFSRNDFNIKQQEIGKLSAFEADNTLGAYARNNENIVNNWQSYIEQGKEIGSGGDVMWNTEGYNIITSDGLKNNPVYQLLHELCHAIDANFGIMMDGNFRGFGIDKVAPLKEWSACIRANCIGSYMGFPMQTIYGGNVDDSGKYIEGSGTRLFDSRGNPFNPFLYE